MNEQRPPAPAPQRNLQGDTWDTVRRYHEARQKMLEAIEEAQRRLVEAQRWLKAHAGR